MFDGRVALVTGASRGLGREIATVFVELGADVALVARQSKDLEEAIVALGQQCRDPRQRVIGMPTDLADAAAAERLVPRVLESFERLDVLVNNAGVIGPIGPLDRNDGESWRAAVAINLLAPVALMRAAIPIMRAQGYGKIINLSGGGATGPRARFTAYAAAKTALVRVTETVAEELLGTGVDVNAVAPGALNTRMLDAVLDAGPESAGQNIYSQAAAQKTEGGASMRQAAELVSFLASHESDGITGRLISAVWDPWRSLPSLGEELRGTDIYTLRRIVPEDRGKHWREFA